MSKKVFLDTGIFFDCLESQDRKTLINHAINRDYRYLPPSSVIGEVILIITGCEICRPPDRFFLHSDEWKITILVPTDDVAIICYEFSQDFTDGRIISQKTDPEPYLAYAIAYDCDYFITSDDALIRYQIPRRVKESDYVKPVHPYP